MSNIKPTNLELLKKTLIGFTQIRLNRIIFIAVLIDSLIYFFWFLRIKFLMGTSIFTNPYLRAFQTTFSVLNTKAMFIFFELWIGMLIMLIVPVLTISLLTKIISRIFGKKLSYSTFLSISIFATIPYLISIIIYYVLTILILVKYQFIFTWCAYLVALLLIIYGVVIIPDPETKVV